MNYSDEDILDILNNLKKNPSVVFYGEIEDCYENIFSYWKPTIGGDKGFAQIILGDNYLAAFDEASMMLWDKIKKFENGNVQLKISVSSLKKWIRADFLKDMNIIEAFELYERESEFIAVDVKNRYFFAVHTEYPSDKEEQLWLYFYEIK
ncbi:hypothetical protein QCD60_15720 [Pokkaliibacter sp. MBI-7]|uniref:hypothetical protein n=1 Tax=Pokkaliibacter sp. MBI-7 TaxID=3040600 RepID=UPI002446D110|nr:hypothetical protein [Pokkaliibacter sp. MBI-7]MDH2434015.1 hypothetical protein [Pokkaliibacter sp. MBI-7]